MKQIGIATYLICTAILWQGCTLAPKYKKPAVNLPTSFSVASNQQDLPLATNISWKEFFTDERIHKVLVAALSNNVDLKIATLNVELARALYGIKRDELFPAVSAVGEAAKQKTATDLTMPNESRTVEKYDVSFGTFGWEIDLFGRIRSQKQKALEEFFSSQYAKNAARLSIISSVATIYFAVAADKEHIDTARETLNTQQSSFNLMESQYKAGLITEIDLFRVKTTVEFAKASLAQYQQQYEQDLNALKLLVGYSLNEDDMLPASLSELKPNKEFNEPIGSEILFARPDVMKAESELKAANADIGAARAAFFPRISLTTTYGTASDALSGLFKAGNDTWLFAPQVSMPIFDARTFAALRASKAQQKVLIAQYEKTIQNAFKEVADLLAIKHHIGQQITAQKEAVLALENTLRLANVRYEKGIDSYLSVLDAQRSLFDARQNLITLRFVESANQVKLYVALGGGL